MAWALSRATCGSALRRAALAFTLRFPGALFLGGFGQPRAQPPDCGQAADGEEERVQRYNGEEIPGFSEGREVRQVEIADGCDQDDGRRLSAYDDDTKGGERNGQQRPGVHQPTPATASPGQIPDLRRIRELRGEALVADANQLRGVAREPASGVTANVVERRAGEPVIRPRLTGMVAFQERQKFRQLPRLGHVLIDERFPVRVAGRP